MTHHTPTPTEVRAAVQDLFLRTASHHRANQTAQTWAATWRAVGENTLAEAIEAEANECWQAVEDPC